FVVDGGLQQGDCESIAKGWDVVKRNQDRISGLVMDMLSYSKDRQPERQSVNMREIANEVVEMLLPRATEVGVALEIDAPTDLGLVSIDAIGIHRALWNVIANGIDSCVGVTAAVVRVSLEHREAEQLIRVVDQGIGIAAHRMERIFVPFVSDKGSQGTGLGLAVSRKILREHGGDLTVSSVEGQGSTFELSVPVGTVRIDQTGSDSVKDSSNTGVHPHKSQ
ncbi:MAG: HAMP domain-containing histidine kinase, partial [Planctomycetaceae bacterium]|nr:HAMP domain-containing histidine kinase [Planctomycetaceae bacterium]